MNNAVIVISGHLILKSVLKYSNDLKECDKVIFFTSQYVYENERSVLRGIHPNVEFVCFADVMTDEEGERCDFEAFKPYYESNNLELKSMYAYFKDLTRMKNEILLGKVEEKFSPTIKYVASDDLGIDIEVWKSGGYEYIHCESCCNEEDIPKGRPLMKRIFQKDILWKVARKFYLNYPRNLFVAHYNGTKVLFHGHLARTGYRINLKFEKNQWESFKHWVIKCLYVLFKLRIERKNTINLTTLHEYGNYAYYEMMDIPEFHNYLFQDGYLPPNDSCKYLFFYGRYSNYYTWDKLGNKVFQYHSLPSTILPFRKNFPIPRPNFRPIKKVLCVSSGAGDWTAIKNRSDDEKTIAAMAEMAKRYPDIEFVCRCHPSWSSTAIQGVNSIDRVLDYFEWLSLPNLKASTNLPPRVDENGNTIVSHKRSSLEADLAEADFVFGVHSISMIDGALQNIPFASINLSGRRDLWKGISDLGFPHCESIEEIAGVIDSVMTPQFQENYLQAVNSYNKIIQEE